MENPIEWLEKLYDGRPAYEEFITPEEFEEAKRMFKEQIKIAFESGWNWNFSSEKYYNETYNQQEERKQHIVDIMKADEEDGLYNENK